jgi:hypothetical protein
MCFKKQFRTSGDKFQVLSPCGHAFLSFYNRRIPDQVLSALSDDIGATPLSLAAPLLLLLPLLLKLQKFVVFAADGSAVQYHIRAAVQRIT